MSRVLFYESEMCVIAVAILVAHTYGICVFCLFVLPLLHTGGLCLLVFLCFAAMLTAIMTLPLVYDNITEIASLVPNLSVDPAIKLNTRTDFARTRAMDWMRCLTFYLCTLFEL